jgi:SP family sugar:H+ symporter-like MFS transporter
MKYFNKSLLFTVLVLATSTLNYGVDNQAFATTQAMDAFTRQFGVQNKNGKYVLDEQWLSLFSGLIYLGFGVGASLLPQT